MAETETDSGAFTHSHSLVIYVLRDPRKAVALNHKRPGLREDGVKRTRTHPYKGNSPNCVLIVDDNPGMRKAVAKAFLSNGFAVCGEAENGRDAIDLAKKLTPDLIILDLSMPVMNGLQAAAELRKIVPATPTILFTMFGNELVSDQASKIGIDLVVSKTESLDSVVRKAHKLMVDHA